VSVKVDPFSLFFEDVLSPCVEGRETIFRFFFYARGGTSFFSSHSDRARRRGSFLPFPPSLECSRRAASLRRRFLTFSSFPSREPSF